MTIVGGVGLRYWWGVFRTSDPDLGRLRSAFRATASAGLATIAVWGVFQAVQQPMRVGLVGVVVAMFGSTVVSDPEARDRRTTMALFPLVAAVSLALGSALAPWLWARQLGFLAVIATAVMIRRFGPRYVAVGMIGFFTYFFATLFQAHLSTLPWMVAAVTMSVGIAYLIRFHLLPDDPGAQLRRALDAFPGAVDLALMTLVRLTRVPRWGRSERHLARRAVARVNGVALKVEDHLDQCSASRIHRQLSVGAVRRDAFELELAVERLAASVSDAVADSDSAAQRATLAAALRDAQSTLRTRSEPGAAAEAGLSAAMRTGYSWERVHHDLGDLVAARQALLRGEAEPGEEDRQPPGSAVDTARPLPAAGDQITRQTIQATVAAGLAIAAGYAISPQRWYWAVIAAFIMFARASTLGESLVRGWQRILGTAFGVLGGIVLAGVVGRHPIADFAILFGAMFVGLYLMPVAYTGMALAITLMLSALYSLLGRFTADLMLLRLSETSAGCAIAALVAAVVLPTPTRPRITSAITETLRSIADVLECALVQRPATRQALFDQSRQMDRSLLTAKDAARPLTTGLGALASRGLRHRIHLLNATCFFIRHLPSSRGTVELGEADPGGVAGIGRRLAENARAVAASAREERGADASPAPDPVVPARYRIEDLRDRLSQSERLGQGPGSPRAALHWLQRADGSLVELARSYEVGIGEQRSGTQICE